MKRLKILRQILKQTGADKILGTFLIYVALCAFILEMIEPNIHSFGEGLWYCYAVISTTGFGDVVVVSKTARILSILLSVYAVLIIAIVTGVVVNYYTHIVELRKKDSLQGLIDKLKRLPEMDKDELEEISKEVKERFN